jgi:glycosyltransferase involved in cell wall biosynthesis
MVNKQQNSKNGLSIAIMGTRGLPAAYGGFETFAEEISVRLVERGHRVTVYGRQSLSSGFTRSKFPLGSEQSGLGKAVELVAAPTIFHKYLETIVASASSFLHSLFQSYDVILLCNAANSPFAWIGRMRAPVAINVDGIERLRSKWNRAGKLWYLLGERCSTWFASRIVADAEVSDYYKERYSASSTVIAYGATAKKIAPGAVLAELGLTAGNYILYVSRLEPENNALGVIQGYNRAKIKVPLVIVGDAPYANEYKQQLIDEAGKGVVFAGYRFGDSYHELRTSCLAYIQATEVGGTHPALIEGMAHGNCIIANGTPENIEVLGDSGLIYERNDFVQLTALMQQVCADAHLRENLGQAAKRRAEERYSWDAVTALYERLFFELAG